MTFRSRLFVTSAAAAALALAVATPLTSWSIHRAMNERIERSLINEARLAAETLSRRRPAAFSELAADARALAGLLSVRVTFISAGGETVGDSQAGAGELRTAENRAGRPEIVQARTHGLGIARRFSATTRTDMLYVAVPVHNPDVPALAFVRLAVPLTGIREQLAAVQRIALAAFGLALAAALALSWGASVVLSRRVRAIAGVAERYAAGDLSRPARDYGNDEIGTVARILDETVHDIGRRAAELASDRARMVAILSGMVEGVLVVNEAGRVQLVNDAARRMLRLQDAPEGRHYLEIVRHPDVAAQIGAALRGDTPPSLELTLPRDRDLIIIARGAPVAAPSGRGAVLVLHDITDLRRADRIRRDFVANVSHELRTPLTAVRGYIEALLDGGADQAESRRFLEIIARHTLRMERLVRDLLRLARLDAGQEVLEHSLVPVDELFISVEADLASVLGARRQTVEHRIAPEAATVSGDPAKLHDVLRNLLENATNYSPDAGLITMAAERHGDRIRLTIADEGPGIPEADLPRIFERFYRADKARSRGARDPGGTGLGLAIAKHLIELHSGRVTASNRPDGGAVFTVELPL